MRKLLVAMNLIGLLITLNQMPANANTSLDIPVEVTEVLDLGLSDRDELKSLIKVSWRIDPNQQEKVAAFNLLLSVTYADGTAITEKRSVDRRALSVKVEVPSVKTIGRQPPAFIKSMSAKVTAVISKTNH